MPKNHVNTAALKIDFKIDQDGILRIIDIGDGLGADLDGFHDKPVSAIMLRDMHAATGAPIIPIYGELQEDFMCLENIDIPVVLRPQWSAAQSCLDAHAERGIPYSGNNRFSSFISYAWSKQTGQTVLTPISLMATEMHKILWYFLMQKEMKTADQPPLVYWCNKDSPNNIDITAINMQYGVFIKIADRSDGGGSDVYYAKNEQELISILMQLHQNKAPNQNHIFIIEPAYLTIRQAIGKDYNVTGRAFITLMYDKSTDSLDVKIAAANWMFPLEPFQVTQVTQAQMLSNIKNSIQMLSLTEQELQNLSDSLLGSYETTFKASFKHDDLRVYCEAHPYMPNFLLCLRPNACYKLLLEKFCGETRPDHRTSYWQLLTCVAHSVAGRDLVPAFRRLLSSLGRISEVFFAPSDSTPEQIMVNICTFSFFENYLLESNRVDTNQRIQMQTGFSFLPELYQQLGYIQSILNKLIIQYLRRISSSYDIQDMNRALRQAAFIGDIIVMKLLIYTRRADVNALSPSKKTVLDCVLDNQNEETKARCLRLLQQLGVVAPLEQNMTPEPATPEMS